MKSNNTTTGRVPKFNQKIVDRSKFDNPDTPV
jgi:hypothetical protein